MESVVVHRAAAESSSRPCDSSLWIQKLEDTKEKNKRPAPSSTCASLRVPFSPSLLSLSLPPALFRFLCPALVRVCGCVCVCLSQRPSNFKSPTQHTKSEITEEEKKRRRYGHVEEELGIGPTLGFIALAPTNLQLTPPYPPSHVLPCISPPYTLRGT